MTTARAVLLSAVLIAATIIGAAWWSGKAQGQRYQLVNVGSGETARLDRQTGDLIQCKFGRCKPLARGQKIVAPMTSDWDQFEPAGTSDAPPPPQGYTRDNLPMLSGPGSIGNCHPNASSTA